MPKLTKRRVESAKPTPTDYILWDDMLPGFGLRVFPSGRRSYLVQYRSKGRTRRYTLGPHGALTAEGARRIAARRLGDVREGGDPSAERKVDAQALTMAELARRYLDEHAYPKKKPSSVVGDECHLKLHILPSLGRLRVSDVKRADIATLHHSLRSVPYTANRVLSLLSKMFSLAERWGLRSDGANPCLHVERFREHARERFLSQRELARLGDVLRDVERQQLESPSVVAAIRLLLLTGARRSEILNLRWEYIDFERATINLPDSKTGAKTIPLNAPALEVLTGLDQTSEWVLPGARSDAPLVNLTRPWFRIRCRAQLDGVRIHDLRHSFASVAAGAGASLPVIGRLLGHSQPSTTQRYAHLADDIVRSTAEEVGERLGPALSGMRLATVVPLKRR